MPHNNSNLSQIVRWFYTDRATFNNAYSRKKEGSASVDAVRLPFEFAESQIRMLHDMVDDYRVNQAIEPSDGYSMEADAQLSGLGEHIGAARNAVLDVCTAEEHAAREPTSTQRGPNEERIRRKYKCAQESFEAATQFIEDKVISYCQGDQAFLVWMIDPQNLHHFANPDGTNRVPKIFEHMFEQEVVGNYLKAIDGLFGTRGYQRRITQLGREIGYAAGRRDQHQFDSISGELGNISQELSLIRGIIYEHAQTHPHEAGKGNNGKTFSYFMGLVSDKQPGLIWQGNELMTRFKQ